MRAHWRIVNLARIIYKYEQWFVVVDRPWRTPLTNRQEMLGYPIVGNYEDALAFLFYYLQYHRDESDKVLSEDPPITRAQFDELIEMITEINEKFDRKQKERERQRKKDDDEYETLMAKRLNEAFDEYDETL